MSGLTHKFTLEQLGMTQEEVDELSRQVKEVLDKQGREGMNDIKVLQCCDSCKWGESDYEGIKNCVCPKALARAREIWEFNNSQDEERKEIDWIYDCFGDVSAYISFFDECNCLRSWGSNQCEYWELRI